MNAGPPRHSGSGPAERLRGFVETHFDFAWRALRRFGLSAADADDGAQKVFLIVAKNLERIEPGKEKAYLFGTAQRVASDMRRSKARRAEAPALPDTEAVDPAPTPEDFADQKRARSLLDGVMDTMPEDMRTVFVLFELEELSVPEIAGLLAVPEGTVASRLRRARELFRAGAERIRVRAAFRGGDT